MIGRRVSRGHRLSQSQQHERSELGDAGQREQTHLLVVEVLDALHAGGLVQPTVELVGPAMIRALRANERHPPACCSMARPRQCIRARRTMSLPFSTTPQPLGLRRAAWCRHTLAKARSSPSSPRITMYASPATSPARNCPGRWI
mgnify:CR=1 FL=1